MYRSCKIHSIMRRVAILYTGTPIHTHHEEHVACCEPFRFCWVLYLVPDEGDKPCSESRNFRASKHQLIHRTHSTGHTEVWGSPGRERTHWGWGWDHWARPAIPAFWWRRWGGWNLWLLLSHNNAWTGVLLHNTEHFNLSDIFSLVVCLFQIRQQLFKNLDMENFGHFWCIFLC